MVRKTLSQMYSAPRCVGTGGCAKVYRSVHKQSGISMALKICCINDSMDLAIHEWLTYKRLISHCPDHIGIPRPLEFGVIKNNDESISTWMTLELLGPSLEELARIGKIGRGNFLQYALAMLELVEYIHVKGLVHNDIKPSNLCIGSNVGRVSQPRPLVYAIDFAFASDLPTTDLHDHEITGFLGTPDYASSSALCEGLRTGPRDDLESLCYTFLELWNGYLPWNVGQSSGRSTPNNSSLQRFTTQRLACMFTERQHAWESGCRKGRIPGFLQQWHKYCTEDLSTPSAIPSYILLRTLLRNSLAEQVPPVMKAVVGVTQNEE